MKKTEIKYYAGALLLLASLTVVVVYAQYYALKWALKDSTTCPPPVEKECPPLKGCPKIPYESDHDTRKKVRDIMSKEKLSRRQKAEKIREVLNAR